MDLGACRTRGTSIAKLNIKTSHLLTSVSSRTTPSYITEADAWTLSGLENILVIEREKASANLIKHSGPQNTSINSPFLSCRRMMPVIYALHRESKAALLKHTCVIP